MEGSIFICSKCNSFRALTLRGLLNHYFTVHSNETNFRVVCGVDDCPAIFTKYNSFYKHVRKQHRNAYDAVTGGKDTRPEEDDGLMDVYRLQEDDGQGHTGYDSDIHNDSDSDVNFLSSSEEESDDSEEMTFEDQVKKVVKIDA